MAVLRIGLAVAFTVLLASRYLAAELAAALVVAWLLAGRRINVRAVVVLALAVAVTFGAVQVVRAPERSSGRELAFALERTVSRSCSCSRARSTRSWTWSRRGPVLWWPHLAAAGSPGRRPRRGAEPRLLDLPAHLPGPGPRDPGLRGAGCS